MNTLVIPGPDTKSIAILCTKSAGSDTPKQTTTGVESLKSTSERIRPPLLDPEAVDSLLRGATVMREGIVEAGAKIVRTFELFSKMLGEALLYPCQNEMDPYNGLWPEREPVDIPACVIGAGDFMRLTVVVMNSLPLPTIRSISDRAYYQITVPSFLDGEIASEPAWEAGLLSGHQYTIRADHVQKDVDGFLWMDGRVIEVAHPLACSLDKFCPASTNTEGGDFYITPR